MQWIFFLFTSHIMGTEKIVLNMSGTQPHGNPLREISFGFRPFSNE